MMPIMSVINSCYAQASLHTSRQRGWRRAPISAPVAFKFLGAASFAHPMS
jgi:hypothetical protein